MITFKQYLQEARYFQEPKRIKSATSLIRKASGVRGRTAHTGRGAWELYGTDLNREQALNNIINKLPEWKRKDIVIAAAQAANGDLYVAFSDYIDNSYQTFIGFATDDRYLPDVLGVMTMGNDLAWYYKQVPGLKSIL